MRFVSESLLGEKYAILLRALKARSSSSCFDIDGCNRKDIQSLTSSFILDDGW